MFRNQEKHMLLPTIGYLFILFAMFVAALFVASVAAAGTVPFVAHTIEVDLDGARSVYATDVDGDGDGDVLRRGFQ